MATKKLTSHQQEVRKQRSIEQAIKDEAGNLKKQYTQKTLGLITSGFGLVAALAWNEVIKEAVNIYIKPFFGETSGVVSLLIYAVIVTALVVFISYNLSKFSPEDNKK